MISMNQLAKFSLDHIVWLERQSEQQLDQRGQPIQPWKSSSENEEIDGPNISDLGTYFAVSGTEWAGGLMPKKSNI